MECEEECFYNAEESTEDDLLIFHDGLVPNSGETKVNHVDTKLKSRRMLAMATACILFASINSGTATMAHDNEKKSSTLQCFDILPWELQNCPRKRLLRASLAPVTRARSFYSVGVDGSFDNGNQS